ncbi:RDD family protein [Aliiglaciecola sp. CAU 1673]|uniref:RDD family protein n=1 Tax=Aliiglaciecola sp. CAU 1673 TaxID=3032595 RepID=UPI0023DB48EF|nr:RDD family protein [Aliiglaciecola sp. CAU 1673]MDF2178595.1 RDD family protein [Aliiglaciecola sp. CAU 1673]
MPKSKKQKSNPATTEVFPRAGFFRRLAAIVYDALMAVAVGMCAAMVMLVLLILLLENGVLEKQGLEHSSEVIRQSLLYTSILQVWVIAWVIGFFLWFWVHGGQTIGMRAWRLRLFSLDDKPMGYGRALLRLMASLGGLGTLLVLLDIKYKQSLQDRIARTEMLVLSKEANHHKAWNKL